MLQEMRKMDGDLICTSLVPGTRFTRKIKVHSSCEIEDFVYRLDYVYINKLVVVSVSK